MHVLTAFNFNMTQLTIHGEVLKIHRAGCGNGQSRVINRSKRMIEREMWKTDIKFSGHRSRYTERERVN